MGSRTLRLTAPVIALCARCVHVIRSAQAYASCRRRCKGRKCLSLWISLRAARATRSVAYLVPHVSGKCNGLAEVLVGCDYA